MMCRFTTCIGEPEVCDVVAVGTHGATWHEGIAAQHRRDAR